MNIFKKNNIYHGFKFLQEEEVKEINSRAFIFQHVKSGARLLYLENDDDNKVFSISFRTPPKDSTGVFHILEHSVLCGSEKYPVKEPFVELLKGSLNTFLNYSQYISPLLIIIFFPILQMYILNYFPHYFFLQ